MQPVDRLIVAFDVAQRAQGISLAKKLRDRIGMAKIGLEAFVALGPSFVSEVKDAGLEVFLDLKLHDIPNTVAGAARQASALGVRLLTVHAQGGAEMIRAARAAVKSDTQIIAVTVLTSLDDAAVAAMGSPWKVEELAQTLGRVARDAGADGLVCSAHELATLSELGGTRVVPGIRPSGGERADQRRVATPADAVRAGATWIVVGRPILESADPAGAAAKIVDEIARRGE